MESHNRNESKMLEHELLIPEGICLFHSWTSKAEGLREGLSCVMLET